MSSTWPTELLGDDGGEWTPEKIDGDAGQKKTVQANFVKPLPVYIVYFSVGRARPTARSSTMTTSTSATPR